MVSPDIPLSEQLDTLRAPSFPPAPSFEISNRAVKRVLDHFGQATEKPVRSPEIMLQKMLEHIRTWAWDNVPMSFIAQVTRLVFSAPFRSRADVVPIIEFLLQEMAVSDRAGFQNAMIRAYIATFDVASTQTRMLAMALGRRVADLPHQWRAIVGQVPEFFDVDHVADAIANKMDGMQDVWRGVQDIGFRQPHAPGLMDAAHLAFVRKTIPRLNRIDEVERLLAWLRPAGQPARSSGAAEVIDALIMPWRKTQPPQETLKLLTDRISELYGHPKVNRDPIWNLVAPETEQIFLHWMTGANIRFLFKVLAEVEKKHMWSDREDFWWNLYEQGRIDAVWIAFNTEGYNTATYKLTKNGGNQRSLFAKQVGETDKSLLIMKIGKKIVIEGTYNFQVHIFNENDPNAPKLYQTRYDVRDIRTIKSAEKKMHHPNWQYWVMANI